MRTIGITVLCLLVFVCAVNNRPDAGRVLSLLGFVSVFLGAIGAGSEPEAAAAAWRIYAWCAAVGGILLILNTGMRLAHMGPY